MNKTYELVKKNESHLTTEEMYLLLVGVANVIYVGDAINRREHDIILRAVGSAFRGLCENEEDSKKIIEETRKFLDDMPKADDKFVDKDKARSVLQQLMDMLND